MNRRTIAILLSGLCSVAAASCGQQGDSDHARDTAAPHLANARSTADNGVLLRLNLPKGPVPVLQYDIDQKIQETIQGHTLNIHQVISMGMAADVLGTDAAGNMNVRFTFRSLKQTMESPGVKASSQLQDKLSRALVGKSYDAMIDARGHVGSITGLDKVMDAVITAINLPPGPQATAIESTLKQNFGESAMKENLSRMLATYPEKPVHVGDSWPVTQSISHPYPMTVNTHYRLVSVSGGLTKLVLDSTLATTPGASMAIGTTKTKLTMKGTQTGTESLDTKTGWVRDSKLQQNLSGSISVAVPGRQQELSIPMTIQSTITINSLKK